MAERGYVQFATEKHNPVYFRCLPLNSGKRWNANNFRRNCIPYGYCCNNERAPLWLKVCFLLTQLENNPYVRPKHLHLQLPSRYTGLSPRTAALVMNHAIATTQSTVRINFVTFEVARKIYILFALRSVSSVGSVYSGCRKFGNLCPPVPLMCRFVF